MDTSSPQVSTFSPCLANLKKSNADTKGDTLKTHSAICSRKNWTLFRIENFHFFCLLFRISKRLHADTEGDTLKVHSVKKVDTSERKGALGTSLQTRTLLKTRNGVSFWTQRDGYQKKVGTFEVTKIPVFDFRCRIWKFGHSDTQRDALKCIAQSVQEKTGHL